MENALALQVYPASLGQVVQGSNDALARAMEPRRGRVDVDPEPPPGFPRPQQDILYELAVRAVNLIENLLRSNMRLELKNRVDGRPDLKVPLELEVREKGLHDERADVMRRG